MKVKCVDSGACSYITTGREYEAVESRSDSSFYLITDDGGSKGCNYKKHRFVVLPDFPNPPHKHAEVIKAWADGAVIQCKSQGKSHDWWDCVKPDWTGYLYRIKPTPDNTKEIESIRVEMEELAKRLKNLEN